MNEIFCIHFSTKALVLELLAAICLVKGECLHISTFLALVLFFKIPFHLGVKIGGHEIILESFDRFKDICSEKRRFQTLMGPHRTVACQIPDDQLASALHQHLVDRAPRLLMALTQAGRFRASNTL
jgi:hypothetical protein